MLCATYLINRKPLKSLNLSSPYFKLYNINPSLSHLRVFGCLCFVSTIKAHRTKFEPRVTPCVFIRYSNSQKGHKVLDLENNKIFISRDVIFHEHHLPFHFKSATQPSDAGSIFMPTITPILHSNINPYSTFSHVPDSTSSQTAPSPQSSPSTTPIHPSSPSPENTTINPSTSPPPILNDTSVLTPVRRSVRQSKPPTYLKDFYCNAVQSTENYTPHWCNLVTFPHTSPFHQALALVHRTQYLL